jgi:glycosyltransferase involved in cell wall biosynthesis
MSWGGQGIRILTESLWMRDRGHRLVILAPKQSRLLEEAANAGLETHTVPFAKSTQAADLRKLVRYLRHLHPDILNTHSSVDTWVSCLAGQLCRIPAIIRTRHLGKPVHPHLLNRWLYGSLCHHVFTTGAGITQALIRNLRLPPSHVSTIPTGIRPPARLPQRAAARHALIEALDLPPETRFIGCLAVLRQGKGHHVLIDAFRHIQAQLPHHHLLIIGGGGYRHVLEARIKDANLQQRIHLTGYRSDTWNLLRALDIHVLASTSVEGTPQAILQAQFANCPVIASASGGITEVIAHGHTGLLVPPGAAEPLAQALLHLLTHSYDADKMAHKAQTYVQSHHTLDHMGAHILTQYDKLLKGRT